MSRTAFVGLIAIVLLAAGATEALAQRDSGAKARGEIGTGFWGQRSTGSQYYASPRVYQPAPAVGTYRSFSYEPQAIQPGDTVVVQAPEARVMSGRDQVGALDSGQEFEVTRVVNGWLGVVTERDGEELRGWVWHRDVTPQATTPPATSRGVAPQQGFRRFSYEPAQVPALTAPAPVQRSRPAQQPTPPEVRLRPGTRRY